VRAKSKRTQSLTTIVQKKIQFNTHSIFFQMDQSFQEQVLSKIDILHTEMKTINLNLTVNEHYDELKRENPELKREIQLLRDKIDAKDKEWTEKYDLKEKELADTKQSCHEMERRLHKPVTKGKDFENFGVNPILQNLQNTIPECTFTNTRTIDHAGDATIEFEDFSFTCNIESKSKTGIHKTDILHAIKGATTKKTNACILVYEQLPVYCNTMNNLYDMSKDEKSNFPAETLFSRSKMLICKPETLELALSILLVRHVTSERITYSVPKERKALWKNLINLLRYQAEIIRPWIASTNIAQLTAIDKEVGKIANRLYKDTCNSHKCDKDQQELNELLKSMIPDTTMQLHKTGNDAPKMFAKTPTTEPEGTLYDPYMKRKFEWHDDNGSKRAKFETGETLEEERHTTIT
jgi:hypothetical protein